MEIRKIGELSLGIAMSCLEHSGHEVVDAFDGPTGEKVIVADDGLGALVFARVNGRSYRRGDSFPPIGADDGAREDMERAMLAWCSANAGIAVTKAVRFDVFEVFIQSDSTAVVRHHVNAF